MNTISPEVKTALVTGTDHGVGFSLAKKLLSRGYFVIAVRVDETEKQIDALQSSYLIKWQLSAPISEVMKVF